MRRPSLYRQGVSIYVIGTENVQEACQVAGINPETHQWAGTDYGYYARRRDGWRACSDIPASRPKDARAGVVFVGPIRRRDIDEGVPDEQ